MREGADNANVELGAMLAVVVLLAVIRIVGTFTGDEAEPEALALNTSAPEAPVLEAPPPAPADSVLQMRGEAMPLGDSLQTAAVDLTQEGAKAPEADAPEAEPPPIVSTRPPPPPSVDLSTLLDSTEEAEMIAEATRELTLSSPALRSAVPAMTAPPPPAPTRPPPPVEEPAAEPEPEIFELVENMPELIGGLAGLQSRIQYPELARRMGIEGRVFVQFVVDEQGRPSNVRIARGIGGGCDEAAVEAVRQSRFTPGRQRGRPVKVRMSLPVTFRG